MLPIRPGKLRSTVQILLQTKWKKNTLDLFLVFFKFKEWVVAEFVIMPLSASKESLMMVAVLCNAPEESLNSRDNVIFAITPARTAVEVNLTNAPLVEQVWRISPCSFFPFLGLEVLFSLCSQGHLLEPIK